jgi:hypothetical protein
MPNLIFKRGSAAEGLVCLVLITCSAVEFSNVSFLDAWFRISYDLESDRLLYRSYVIPLYCGLLLAGYTYPLRLLGGRMRLRKYIDQLNSHISSSLFRLRLSSPVYGTYEGRPENNATHFVSHSQLILSKLQICHIIT